MVDKRIFFALSFLLVTFAASAQNEIPKGSIEGPFQWTSEIYPGTVRDYWLYVPAQYDPSRPTCSMIVQDGLRRAEGWNLPHVLDSLIEGEIVPVMIGIFVDHGKVPSANPSAGYPRFNRSFEYDALGDRYARFLIEELLPEISSKYNLSSDPDDRCIAGASSGAICAFNAAWERPDAFRRVLSTIGTYVGLRGGDQFPTLVRKTEPKPLRVFLEDGNTDLNIYAGDWWVANQDMLSALEWAGYEVDHAWGTDGHNSNGARVIMAQALTWLWKDYPKSPEVHLDQYQGLNVMGDNPRWRRYLPHLLVDRMTVDSSGNIFFIDLERDLLYRIEQNQYEILYELEGNIGAVTIGGDNQLYLSDLDNERILRIDTNGHATLVVDGIYAEHLLGSSKGLYFANNRNKTIGYYSLDRNMVNSIEIDKIPSGLALSAEQTYLIVSNSDGVFGQSFKITTSGALQFGQDYIHYHIPYGQPLPQAAGVTVDEYNRTYTATKMGIQVADQLGRINLILNAPEEAVSDLTFGGPDFKMLYLISDRHIYRRELSARGFSNVHSPLKPPAPKM